MGMLMYEDMKVSVLQLLKMLSLWVRKIFSFFHTHITNFLGDEGRVQGNLLSVEKSGVAAG